MTKPLIILGAGGHAAVLVDVLRQQKREIIGLISPGDPPESKILCGIPHLTRDDDILNFDKSSIKLVNGIGSLPGNGLRASLFNHFVNLEYKFETVVASTSIVSSYAELGEGVQVMPGAIIQARVFIGANSIINTGAIVDHDCNIGINNHVAPGVTLSGQVQSMENVHFGTGASVIQSILIGQNVVVGAGANITKNIGKDMVCLPAPITTKVKK